MHDTAYEVGRLIIGSYCDAASATILETGALDEHGRRQAHLLPTTHYFGVDASPGRGVDLVVSPGQNLNVPDDSFDLVLASSTFEQDPAFWSTFVDLCRKSKPGGFVYVGVSLGGLIASVANDRWRFYPGAGSALARWAKTQGLHVDLIESFVAESVGEQRDFFAAVFRKAGKGRKLPETPVGMQLGAANTANWMTTEATSLQMVPQVMRAIADAKSSIDQLTREMEEQRVNAAEAARQFDKERAEAREQLDDAKRQGEQERAVSIAQLEQIEDIRARSNDQMAELTEALQATETARMRLESEKLQAECERVALATQLEREREQQKLQISQADEQRAQADDRAARLAKTLEAMQSACIQLESELRQREEEIEQTLRLMEQTKDERAAAERDLAAMQRRAEDADAWVFQLAGERHHAQREASQAIAGQKRAEQALTIAEVERADALERLRGVESVSRAAEIELGALQRVQRRSAELEAELASNRASTDSSLRQIRAEVALGQERVARQAAALAEARIAQRRLQAEEEELRERAARHATSVAHDRIVHRKLETENRDHKLTLERITRERNSNGEQLGKRQADIRWLSMTMDNIGNSPGWWQLLPSTERRKRIHAKLREAGLFDGEKYLERYADVAEYGMDPLEHYIRHGIAEGRAR